MIGIPLGPIVGGLLLQHFWWGSVFLINLPVALLGLIAVAALVPESGNPNASRLDVLGVLVSAAGMVGVTHGVIEAGDRGWGAAQTLGPLLGGIAVLGAFVPLERRVAATRDPLVDLTLFRSRGYTWGTVLVTIVSFAMFGVLFNTPQYLRGILGVDALGTGLRLLPLLGAMTVSIQFATRVAARTGPKLPVAVGLAVMAVGLLVGATTGAGSGYGFTAAWLAVLGVGLGLALPTAMMAAVGSLASERSGAGSATVYALRQLGSSVGVAILGTLAVSGHRARVDVTGLSAQDAATARASVSSGAAVADRLSDPGPLASVRAAFVYGMDTTLWVCAGISAVAAVLAVALLPGLPRPSPVPAAQPSAPPTDAPGRP